MGCGCSSDTQEPMASDGKKGKEWHIADQKRQSERRRLSVAPSMDMVALEKGDETDPPLQGASKTLSDIEAKAKGDLKIGECSSKGYIPFNNNKVNQDRPVTNFAVGGFDNVCLFGALDGHGEMGHEVSEFVRNELPKCLANEGQTLIENPELAMVQAVEKMCATLKDTQINCMFSGTTCVFSLKIGDTLYTGNIGDSRCCLLRQGADGQYQTLAQSEDQKPENPEEKARILAEGGRVEHLPNCPPGEDPGPYRVWLKEIEVPGLAMSRSIGDYVAQRVGVISIPEIKVHKLEANDRFAVWASDGVWEFMSNETVCNLVAENLKSNGHNYNEAAIALVQAAKAEWRKEEDVIDDITAVIVGFSDVV